MGLTCGASPFVSLVTVNENQRDACEAVFRYAKTVFGQNPTRLNTCQFFSNLLPFLLEIEEKSPDKERAEPTWLTNACLAMHDWQNIGGGLSRFIELSGVTPEHLCRVMKATTGQSPTVSIGARN